MKVLYAGDSPAGGPANYLLGILRHCGAKTTHLAPSETLAPKILETTFDAILLSDYPAKQLPEISALKIKKQVQNGAGLMMIGGWGSFSGPFGGWRGTLIESLLPVECAKDDDRLNFPGGAWIVQNEKHPMLNAAAFKNPPAICGLNQIKPRKKSRTLLGVRKIVPAPSGIKLESKSYPLLVVDENPRMRTAAFATDFAPHWCGGMVDWGERTKRLPVTDTIGVQVGESYIEFVSNLVRWLAGR